MLCVLLNFFTFTLLDYVCFFGNNNCLFDFVCFFKTVIFYVWTTATVVAGDIMFLGCFPPVYTSVRPTFVNASYQEGLQGISSDLFQMFIMTERSKSNFTVTSQNAFLVITQKVIH